MFMCSRCKKESHGPHLECLKCRADVCWNCAAESAGRCLGCGMELSPFRPPSLEPSFEWVPGSE